MCDLVNLGGELLQIGTFLTSLAMGEMALLKIKTIHQICMELASNKK